MQCGLPLRSSSVGSCRVVRGLVSDQRRNGKEDRVTKFVVAPKLQPASLALRAAGLAGEIKLHDRSY